MKFKHTQVMNFEGAFRGMRNPKESHHLSDSHWEDLDLYIERLKCFCSNNNNHIEREFIIGEKDMALAQKLIKGGAEHRKFMRQIFVCVDITAPLYWWKEFDTYKVGTVANSTSTMHKLATTPIVEECFEMDDYESNLVFYTDDSGDTTVDWQTSDIAESIIENLELLRQRYLETKDKKYWKELIRWLPDGWVQKRTLTFTYENLFAMCSKGQRRFHKLNEWSGIDNPNVPNFISWARTLPYAQELIFIDEIDDKTD